MSSSRINDATLRRLQERMEQERIKPPSESSCDMEEENPAGDGETLQPQTIYTQPTHPSTTVDESESERYARQVQRQHELLQQYEQRNDNVDALANQFQQTSLATGRQEGSPISSLGGEELWTCLGCKLDCPMAHRFCGVCGAPRPENWWCACGTENVPYHLFCVRCGKQEDLGYDDLGYEDLGLDAEDQVAIEQTAARLAGDIPNTIPPPQEWDDVDDELTFANESCDVDAQLSQKQNKQAEQVQEEDDDESGAWNCQVCTYVNENPLFMCCEMCGSARPASKECELEAMATASKKGASSRSDDASDDSSKKKEKKFSDMILEQQKHLYEQQKPSGRQQKTLPEPETDHELAMIYAQQERILAQYQQQQAQR